MDQEKRIAAEKREREFEDIIANRYSRDYHEPPIMAAHARAFVEYVARHVKSGDRVLDLGCASGPLWHLFQKIFPADITIVGVDLSPGMLTVAKQNFPEGDFREGSFLDIPAGAGEFDVVIVSSAFHHINDQFLPAALTEIVRVLDEHGILVGREPLIAGRLTDRGGWFSGAIMHLRHLAYRLTHTREYPEPDLGPDHHAYVADEFLAEVGKKLTPVSVEFRNPVSLFLARSQDPIVAAIAKHLDDQIDHRGGQEVLYAARKNYSTAKDVEDCIVQSLRNNEILNSDLQEFMAHVVTSARLIEQKIHSDEKPWKL